MCDSSMDDEDFTATDMCCTCDGGFPDCKDMDFSSTDVNGMGCKDYTYEMCDDMMDDEDFTARTMCCVCGQRTVTATRTSTTTTTLPLSVTTLPVEPDPPLGGFVWWFLLLLIPCLFCFWAAVYCLYRRKPDLPEPELEKPHRDGFVINTTGNSRTFQAETTNTSFNANSLNTSVTKQGTIVVRDDTSEASVYGTACDLCVRPDLARADIASVDDACIMCCSPMTGARPAGGKIPLDGPWHVNGNPNIVATITGSSVVIDGDRGQQECGLRIIGADRIALEVNGMLIQGQLVGNRLIWENGQMWRRAYATGFVPSTPVIGGAYQGAGGGAYQGGAYSNGSYYSQGAYAAGGSSSQAYGYGGAAGRSYSGGSGYGLDTRDIIFRDRHVPGETRLSIGQGAPRALHMGR